MRYGRRSRQSLGRFTEPDLDSALDSMTAEELRSFVRGTLERLDDEPRRELADALLLQAAKGSSVWKPPAPSQRIVAEVRRFAEAACRIGYADPREKSTTAFGRVRERFSRVSTRPRPAFSKLCSRPSEAAGWAPACATGARSKRPPQSA